MKKPTAKAVPKSNNDGPMTKHQQQARPGSGSSSAPAQGYAKGGKVGKKGC